MELFLASKETPRVFSCNHSSSFSSTSSFLVALSFLHVKSTLPKKTHQAFLSAKRSSIDFFLQILILFPSTCSWHRAFLGVERSSTSFFYKISNMHTYGVSFSAKRSSMGFFLQPFFLFFFIFIFSCSSNSSPCELDFIEDKPTKFLLVPKKVWQVFFLITINYLLTNIFWAPREVSYFL